MTMQPTRRELMATLAGAAPLAAVLADPASPAPRRRGSKR